MHIYVLTTEEDYDRYPAKNIFSQIHF